jgi:zinc transporter ZupT
LFRPSSHCSISRYHYRLHSGYSKYQAVQAQFMTAIAAFLGTIVALYFAEGWVGERLVYVTAGGFIYLAAVTILPEVLEDDRKSVTFRLAQLTAFLTGIGFMYMVYLLEKYDSGGSHHVGVHSQERTSRHGHSHGHAAERSLPQEPVETMAYAHHNGHDHGHGHGEL